LKFYYRIHPVIVTPKTFSVKLLRDATGKHQNGEFYSPRRIPRRLAAGMNAERAERGSGETLVFPVEESSDPPTGGER